jgi:hypothetical protein
VHDIEAALGDAPGKLREFHEQYYTNLSKDDPATALAGAEGKITGRALSYMRACAFKALAEKDAPATRQLAYDLPPGKDRDLIVAAICAQSCKCGTDEQSKEALQWLRALPATDSARRGALEAVANEWMRSDAPGLLEFVRHAAPTEITAGFLDHSINYLSSGAAECSAYLLALDANPTLQGSSKAATALASKLVVADVHAAENFINTQPVGRARSAVVSELAAHLWRTDPDAAVALAQKLPAADAQRVRQSMSSVRFTEAESQAYTERIGK